MNKNQAEHISIQRIIGDELSESGDVVAVEEPLEIQLSYSTATGLMHKNVAVTMRTPGNDTELAAGFLFTEGIINGRQAVHEIRQSSSDDSRVLVVLEENVQPVLSNMARNFYSTSSCGVCGKASIDAIRIASPYTNDKDEIKISAAVLYALQENSRKQQDVFEETGGIHASALFTLNGEFIMLREDVGRHNALDKLIGSALLNNQLPLNNCILFLSGRASFELIQKAAMAGIKVVAAVGAPSSLAVEMAKEQGITLVGFLKSNRFNVYAGKERINLK
ncbi:MAG TPA: formate dehydrogenase accessory sulfurtransferase FdhD [Ferruginibacter sp.]|nr:formate dehydrogenase accessory sulfurtransferase FdhD [Chitinophagaceae bacterium]HRI25983.1 formate dehydrogenase accessory sulfurtransferase FdhD [Ferruginibacter sp.]